jgi:hypothetical protein
MLNNNDSSNFTDKDVDDFLSTADSSISLSMKDQQFSAKINGNMLELGTMLHLASEQSESFKNILIATADYYKNK